MSTSFENIGSKIRYFRTKNDFSQFQLELEIGSASGSLSRIESGETSPSKETLSKIISTLKLNPTEVIYLMDNSSEAEKEQAAQEAIATVSKSFSSFKHIYYILDHRHRVVHFSRAILWIGSLVGLDMNKLLGKHPIEILFKPEIGFSEIISPDKFDSLGISILTPWANERDFLFQEDWCKDLFKELSKYEHFDRLWEYVQNNVVDVYSEEARTMYFTFLGKKVKAIYNFTQFLEDTRFTIVELKFTNLPRFLQPKYIESK